MIERIFKKHYTYYDQSRQDYYERSVFPIDINMFLLYAKYQDCQPSLTDIEFKELAWGEIKNKIITQFGKPRYMYNNVIGDSTHSVIFYREKIVKDNFLIQFHFINDIFFFGCYTYKEWNPKKRNGFKSVIVEKYAAAPIDISVNPIKISDTGNNKIIIIDSVNLNIGYFSGDSKAHDLILAADKWQQENAELNKNNKIIKLYSSF